MLDRASDFWPRRLGRCDPLRFRRGLLGAFANLPATEEVDASVVRDAEEPRANRPCIVEAVQLPVGLKERVLHDVLPIQHRARHAGAVSMQAGAQMRDRFEEGYISCLELTGGDWLGGGVHTEIYAAKYGRDTYDVRDGVGTDSA